MIIRPTKESDLKLCEELFDKPELRNSNGESFTVEDLGEYIDEKLFLVAEEDDMVVGAILGEQLKNRGVALWEFSVKEDFQGKGVGSALLKAFEKNVVDDVREWIFLTSPSSSEKTLEFYAKRDYKRGINNFEFFKFLK